MEIPKLSAEQWLELQGGEPKVTQDDGIFEITHPSGMVVRSHHNPYESESVTLKLPKSKQIVIVPCELLQQFHGDPCEQASLKLGGHGYDRVKGVK